MFIVCHRLALPEVRCIRFFQHLPSNLPRQFSAESASQSGRHFYHALFTMLSVVS
jgi:hypothetical protein